MTTQAFTVMDDLAGGGVSAAVLGDVLSRFARAAPEPLSQRQVGEANANWPGRPSLAAGTRNRAVAILKEQGFLIGAGTDATGPGRPMDMLKLSDSSHLMVGCHLGLESDGSAHLTSVLVALDGTVQAKRERQELLVIGGRPFTPTDLVDAVSGEMRALVPTRKRSTLLGLGLDVPGHVFEGRVVALTHGTDWHDVDIETTLARRLKIPVILDNDVNVLAAFEIYRQRYSDPNFVFVGVFDDGIGAALVLEGRVRHGASGMAGEIGHFYVHPRLWSSGANEHLGDPPPLFKRTFDDPCHCGNFHHVDCYAIPRRIANELAVSDFSALCTAPADSATAAEVEVMSHAGRALGEAIAGIVNVINPSRIVIMLHPALETAHAGQVGYAYREQVEATLTTHAYSDGAATARAGTDELSYVSEPNLLEYQAKAAAFRVFDRFIEQSRTHPSNPSPYAIR